MHPCAYFLIGFETEKELMMAWVDRATYMERLWALEDAQSRLFIDEVQLREGFEMASDSIRARGGWDICLTEFELEMREEPEERL